MKKQLYTLLIISIGLITNQSYAQHTNTAHANEAQVSRLTKQFITSVNEYKTQAYAKNNFTLADIKAFETTHYATLFNAEQLAVSKAFYVKNTVAYLAQKQIELTKLTNQLTQEFSNQKNGTVSSNARGSNGVGNTNGTSSLSCSACVTNPGFENNGAFNWEGSFGTIGSQTTGFNMGPDNEINSAAKTHHITTAGNDEIGGFPRVCDLIPDNHHSFRLGNAVNGNGNETVSYQFVVDSLKPYFTYYYAVVLQDAGHGQTDQPYFTVSMTDGSNTNIACADYRVSGTTAANIGGFVNAAGGVLYKPWSPVTVPLIGYIGQCVTITFESRDCTFGGHWGYGYVDAECTAPEIIAPPSICDNNKSQVILKAPKGAGSYAWTGPSIVGATDRDSAVVNHSGQYTCTMTTAITAGGAPCQYSITRNVLAAPFPIASFSAATPCSGQKVSFTNTTVPSGIWSDFLWDFNNDASIDATTLNAEGTFINATQNTISIPVKLALKTDYCNADTVISITINPKPIANAGIDQAICTGDNVTLTSDLSTSYEWYNGLNIFSIVADINQAYTLTPTNTNDYTLVVTNQYGCKDTDNVHVQLNRVPNPDFSAQDVCFPQGTTFTSLSSNTGAGDVYTWAYEAGKTGTGNVSNYTYATCGAKPVTLIISTTDNCANTITKNVNVFCKPVANFTPSNVCLYDSATFTNTSIGNTSITSYQWDFDYGSPNLLNPSYIASNASVANPKQQYFVEGVKNVVLIVTNTDGCKDTTLKLTTIYAIPTALFSANNVCLNTQSLFISTSSINAPDSISQYQWDYNNDGVTDNTSAINTQYYTYPSLYKNDAQLIVTTTNGCKDTATAPVEIYPLPVAQYTANNVCNDSVVTFINNSTVAYGTIKTSAWAYTPNDAAMTNATVNTSFVFPSVNYYPVLLTATTNFGCVDTLRKTITIYPNPVPNFSSNQRGCTPFCATEINTSTISQTPVFSTIANYSWSFGTGDSSTAMTPVYCYPNITDYMPKKYAVTLRVESDYGCVNSITKADYIEVYPKPKASFSVSPTSFVQNTEVVQLHDSSIIATLINWDYDVNYSPVSIDQFRYKTLNYIDSGKYTITQYVESKYGCKDTAYHTIVIKPSYNLFIPNAFTPNDDGMNDSFLPKYFGMKKVDLMIFNRWGELIARVDETNKHGWNGTDDRTQEKCKTDVYIWKVKYTTLQGTTEEDNGKVALLR